MKKEIGKRGAILMENVVFIILNLLFISILIVFLLKQGEGAIVLEQSYAKYIALVIDAAKPGMEIKIDMEKGKKLAEKNNIDFDEIVKISGNSVKIKLSKNGEYIYSFFNDVNVTCYPDTSNPEDVTAYIFKINEYNAHE